MSNSETTEMIRIPIPEVVVEGQILRFITGLNQSIVIIIPSKEEWKVDENGAHYFSYDLSTSPPAPQDQVEVFCSCTEKTPFKAWSDFSPHPFRGVPIRTNKVQTFPLAKVKPTGRLKCLLIGINYAGTSYPLKGCVNDVFKMRKIILPYGVKDDDAHLMMLIDDDPFNGEYTRNVKKPTKKNIMKAMQWLVHGALPGDVLFLQFSGHGSREKDEAGMEDNGFNETILPSDYETTGMISDDTIWSSVVYPLPDGVKLIAVMDSCHSGTVLDLPFEYNFKRSEWKEDTNPSHSAGDVIQFSGCMDNQKSADAGSQLYNAGGAMTAAFIVVLHKNPSPTYEQLIELMTKHLKQQGYKQIPQLTASQRFNAKDKIFSLEGGIDSNKNEVIGRVLRKRYKEKKSIFRKLRQGRKKFG